MKPSDYINRELSWLRFNERVLFEAMDPSVPLLERLRFLAITASNLDEFFMVRVGGLSLMVQQGLHQKDSAGLTPAAQLAAMHAQAKDFTTRQYAQAWERLLPELAAAGILYARTGPASASAAWFASLAAAQQDYLEQLFTVEIASILSPVAVDGARAIPFVNNLTLAMALRLKSPQSGKPQRWAFIPLANSVERVIALPGARTYTYVLLEDMVQQFANRLFPGEEIQETCLFRITRNADVGFNEEFSEDFAASMEAALDARKQNPCVRLEIQAQASHPMRLFLQHAFDLDEQEVYPVQGPLNLGAFLPLCALDGFERFRYEPWPCQMSPRLDLRRSMFDNCQAGAILLVHPYECFDPVLRFVQEAAADPKVLAIKQTLYRTSRNSPVIAALRRASEAGKQVTVVVELKARFDEARNIEWARKLEAAGAQVIYGIKGLKTHAKVCVVVRREETGIVRYVHFGTGNYNENTARLYSDVGYFTNEESLGIDAAMFFNAITGNSQPQTFLKLAAAPFGLREKLLELINGETQRKKQGRRGLIMAKMNSLADPQIIEALYKASQAGVRILLNVRGICCLRPGVKGLSQNISVVSIVDRFLEHARIFYFFQDNEEKVFISSADWMGRNLDRRVELLVPVEDAPSSQRLVSTLKTYFEDTRKAWQLSSDGTYHKVKRTTAAPKQVRSQETLYRQVSAMAREHKKAQRTVLIPHRPPQE